MHRIDRGDHPRDQTTGCWSGLRAAGNAVAERLPKLGFGSRTLVHFQRPRDHCRPTGSRERIQCIRIPSAPTNGKSRRHYGRRAPANPFRSKLCLVPTLRLPTRILPPSPGGIWSLLPKVFKEVYLLSVTSSCLCRVTEDCAHGTTLVVYEPSCRGRRVESLDFPGHALIQRRVPP